MACSRVNFYRYFVHKRVLSKAARVLDSLSCKEHTHILKRGAKLKQLTSSTLRPFYTEKTITVFTS
jgi:hypothetical protein